MLTYEIAAVLCVATFALGMGLGVFAVDMMRRAQSLPMREPSCEVCSDKRYLICERDDGRLAVEKCDNCQPDSFFDADAAVLARRDGIDCVHSYPCFVRG